MSFAKCPFCKEEFKLSYWKWLFNAPQWFSFLDYKWYRLTECPSCHKKAMLRPKKVKAIK